MEHAAAVEQGTMGSRVNWKFFVNLSKDLVIYNPENQLKLHVSNVFKKVSCEVRV